MTNAQPPSAPALAALALASGAAALVYQLVWFQLLALVIGASAPSLGVLLATFMGGLCIGSLACWRVLPARLDPLRVYATLEIATGLAGLAVLLGLPALASAYAAWGGNGGLAARAVLAALCLLPPTVLMGATLPALGRVLDTTPRGAAGLGALYAANLVGGVLGCIVAGFHLLRVYDTTVATLAAAALNGGAAVAAFALGRSSRRQATAPTRAAAAVARAERHTAQRGTLYVAIALSGMTALAAEVVWTRQLSLLLGGTVYTFALILAVVLAGLGAGAALGAACGRRFDPGAALGVCQLLACAAIAWAAFAIARLLPYWPIDPTLPAVAAAALPIDLMRIAFAVLPAAVAWGASVPLAIAAAAAPGGDPARLTGHVYAANTLGAIAGALAAGFVLVALAGSQLTQQLMIAAAAAAGAMLLARPGYRAEPPRRRVALAAGAVAVAAAFAAAVPAVPGELIAYGRFLPTRAEGVRVLFAGEGRSASVAVTEDADGRRSFHSAGKAQASSYPQDMRLQRMLGHLATLAAEEPRSALVIGLGAGVTAGAVAIDPAVEQVVVAELEPLVVRGVAPHFAAESFDVTANPKVRIVIDDGRHLLETSRETFDVITSDPLDPWVKGAAALYTVEFWRLVRSRLRPGGAVTVFVQLYETTEEAVRSELATFFEVFPDGALFANRVHGAGYDAVLLGRAGGEALDVDRLERLLQSVRYAEVARSLREVGFESATALLGTYAAGPSELGPVLRGAALNQDRNLRLQYLAGEGLNRYEAAEIFAALAPRPPALPETLFTGSPVRLERLREAVRAPFAPR